jgi:hypothetical protein
MTLPISRSCFRFRSRSRSVTARPTRLPGAATLTALTLLVVPGPGAADGPPGKAVGRSAGCAADEQSLVGAWGAHSRSDSFEQIAFTIEGGARVFRSWRHERPEIGRGTWSVAACVLRIGHATEPALSWVFRVDRANDGELRLREDGTRRQERYRRLP